MCHLTEETDKRSRIGECPVKAHVAAHTANQALIQNKRHKMFVSAARLDPVRAEPKRKRGLETKAGVIVGTPDQKQQPKARLSHNLNAGANQGAPDTLPLIGRRNSDGSQSRESPFVDVMGNLAQAVGSVPDYAIVDQRDLRQPQGSVSAQAINNVGLQGAAEGFSFQGVDVVDVLGNLVSDGDSHHSSR